MSEAKETKRSIFKQRIQAKRYEFKDWWNDVQLGDAETIDEKIIIVLDVTMPVLEVGSKFYIEELDLLAGVTEHHRTSKDGIVYYIEPKLIEDEMTEITLRECEEKLSVKNYNKIKIADLKEKNTELQIIQSDNKQTITKLESTVAQLETELTKLKSKWFYKMFARKKDEE